MHSPSSQVTRSQKMYRPLYLPSLHQVEKPRREGGKQTHIALASVFPSIILI